MTIQLESPDESYQVDEVITEVLEKKKIKFLTIGFEGIATLWPFTHLRGMSCTREDIKLSSCINEITVSIAEGNFDDSYPRTMGRVMCEWSEWLEHDKYIRKIGKKRRIDDVTSTEGT